MNGLANIDNVARHRVWFIVLGAALIVLGIIAIGASFATTLISVMVFGWLLLIGGIFQGVHALWVRSWSGMLLQFFIGILNIIVGLLIVGNPGSSALALTLLIAAFFLVGGIFRIISAAAEHFPGRGWALFSGLVDVLLGLLIWAHWPSSAFWVIGLFIGIDLIFTGWWFIALATMERRLSVPTEPRGA